MKYMGSKNRIAKHIVPIINELLDGKDYYIEPFVGGANMIDKIRKDVTLIGSDYNEYLISMWKGLQNGFIPKDYYDKETYLHIKDNKDVDKCLTGYVGFNCSYSGKWFGGFAGKVTTKTGVVRDYQDEAKRNAMAQISDLTDIEFRHSSFVDLVIPDNSLVYCDPPYKNTTGYQDGIDHDVFYDWCRDLRKRGCEVLVSEYDMPDDFQCIWELEVKSSLSANGVIGSSKKSIEKLFRLP